MRRYDTHVDNNYRNEDFCTVQATLCIQYKGHNMVPVYCMYLVTTTCIHTQFRTAVYYILARQVRFQADQLMPEILLIR